MADRRVLRSLCMKLGIIREGKSPPDHRTPLTPQHCVTLRTRYPDLRVLVQRSPIRAFSDDEYRAAGIAVVDDLSDCDVLLGVKEVPGEQLIPGKTYLFFSHTFKRQPYNRDLLRTLLAKRITLIDYEVLKDTGGKRIAGFGRYAGVVGAYNGFRAYGQLTGRYALKPAHACRDRKETETELMQVELPETFKLVMTGFGRVAGGAAEILSALRMAEVSPREFRAETFTEPVYTQLFVTDYFGRDDGRTLTRQDFFDHPEVYHSQFMDYARVADVYFPCHYWSSRSPLIFTRADARDPACKLQLVADISCDIDGPVASTLRPSTIADPFYGYDPLAEREVPFGTPASIGVMAVDNLPCELPRDASEDFGNELLKNVLPHFFNGDPKRILARATETHGGQLTPEFAYLQAWVDG